MPADKKNLALLPNGFVDFLPPDAEHEYMGVGKMMMTFASFGYGRVKPPLLEFEESLFAPGPGAAMVDDTFRVMDPVSHRMMGLRSDITPQIARIACSRLGKEQRPLRLCYANDVLRTKASQQRTERQFCQAGCEIVGEDIAEADIEACVVSLIALKEINVRNITIDLSFPRVITQLLGHYECSDDDEIKIRGALARRSPDALNGQGKKLTATLSKLMKAAGPAEKALKELSALADFKADVQRLKSIHDGIARALQELGFADVKITIDPVEMRGFKYYSGFGFTLFAAGIAGELGRGGRYNIHFGGQKPVESATGFTLYMDTVRKAMPKPLEKDVIVAPYEQNWANIRAWQKKGSVVVRGRSQKK